jgi:iron complex outermembrane recepter protein
VREVNAARSRIAVATFALMAGVAQQLCAQDGALITGTVRNAATGAPIANATVSVATSKRSHVTGGDGAYRLTINSTGAELRVTAVGFAPASRSVSPVRGVSTIVDFELKPSAVQLDQVVTTGTRTLERTATRSPVPIDVISSQAMENTGVIETWQQLERLVPSVFGPYIPLGDNGMRPITLRGLAPHHALVLVNGKRRHPAATLLGGPSVANMGFTDLNSIPASAIDHIEVLRDGASAQYGSDAIGGVVNVVLKSGERRDLRTSFGQVFSSEGGRTFHDGRHFDADGTFGVMTRRGAHVTLTGEYRDREGTNRAYPDMRQQYDNGNPGNDEPPRVSSYTGDGTVRNTSFFLTGAAPLNATTEVYAFGGAAYKNNRAPDGFFRRPLDSGTVRAIFPDGFLPRVETRIGDASALVGMRGSLSRWRWDLSSGWGVNRIAYHVDHSNNVSLGAASPTTFYAGRVAAQQLTSNLDLSRDVKLGTIPVTVSAGAELRLDRYQIHAGDSASWRDGGVPILDGPQAGRPASAGAQGMPGLRPDDEVSARRSNAALYFETEGRPFRRLLVQSALRAERYSDFGSTSDAKLAGRVELGNGIAVRGSMSTGFRAPSLIEEYFSSSRTVYRQVAGVGTFLTVRTFPVNSAGAQLIGAVKLRPETSVNRSAGVVISRPSLPVITADYYEIRIDHRIGLTGPVTDTSIVRLFDENGMRGIGGGNYFANRVDTRTRGVDVVASHAFLLTNAGVLRMLGGYNYNKTLVTHVAPPPAPLAAFESQLFNRTSRGIIEQGQPRQTISLGLNYSTGPLGLNVHNQRSGPTAQLDRAPPAAGGKDQHVDAKWVTDIRASYQLRSRVEVAISAANVFDVYPNEWRDFKDGVNARGFSNSGMFRYPGALSAVGQNGRTLYLQLAYR